MMSVNDFRPKLKINEKVDLDSEFRLERAYSSTLGNDAMSVHSGDRLFYFEVNGEGSSAGDQARLM